MINDIDIMSKAIQDARKLYFMRDANGNSLDGITRRYGCNDHSWASHESTEIHITKLAITLFNTRIKLLDRGEFSHLVGDSTGNIELDNEFTVALKQSAEERAYALLEKELGAEAFQALQTSKSVRLGPKDGMFFTISLDGRVIIEWKQGIINRDHTKTCQIYNNNYHMADNLATLVKWIKIDPELVYRVLVKSCGNIEVKGGELI